jgi:hypothetical protein
LREVTPIGASPLNSFRAIGASLLICSCNSSRALDDAGSLAAVVESSVMAKSPSRAGTAPGSVKVVVTICVVAENLGWTPITPTAEPAPGHDAQS